jgi:hypothetical protein
MNSVTFPAPPNGEAALRAFDEQLINGWNKARGLGWSKSSFTAWLTSQR